MKSWYRLTVNRCALHPDFWAICLEDEHGGTRLTGSKCCGRWDGISRKSGKSTSKGPYVEFYMYASQLESAAEALSNAAIALREQEEKEVAAAGERGSTP